LYLFTGASFWLGLFSYHILGKQVSMEPRRYLFVVRKFYD